MIELTDEQLKAIENYEASITKQRADAWAEALEKYDKSGEAKTTLAKKIAQAEMHNKIVARPTMPQKPDFQLDSDVTKYIHKLKEQAEHGTEKAEQRALYEWLGSAKKAWGSEIAREIENLAKTNPSKSIEAVNSNILPPAKYVYFYQDKEEVENILQDFYDFMKEE